MVSEYLPCVFSSTKSPALLIAVSTLSAFCESRSLALSRNPMHCSFPMGFPNVPREPFAGKTLLAAAGGQRPLGLYAVRRRPSAAVSGVDKSEEGRGIVVKNVAQPDVVDAVDLGERRESGGIGVRNIGKVAAEQDFVAQVAQSRQFRCRERHRFVDEGGEGHGGIESHIVVVRADVEKLAILRHAHVRDDQGQAGESAQHRPDGVRAGESAWHWPGTAV